MSSDESKPFIWQSLHSQDRMKHLLKTGHLSDCSFCVLTDENEKITIKCHKFVLMCSSPVFERMFEGDFDESRDSENIVLDDVSAADFKTFIEYLYLNDKKAAELWDLQALQNLIYLSKKFMIDDLTDLCFSTIINGISKCKLKEIINLYVYAHQMDHKELMNEVSLIFVRNHIKVFKSPAILDLNLDTFFRFISDMSSFDAISQLDLFNVVEKYCKENGLDKEAPGPIPSKLCQTNTEDDYNNGEKKETETDAEEKKALNEEKKMLQKVKREYDKIAVEEKETLNQVQEKEHKLDKEENNEVEKESQNKEYIAKLLGLVKFKAMTASQFCNGPGLSSIMDLEMKYNTLVQIVKKMSQFNWK